jgi:AmiR/NasT family two-component response regulator
VATIGILQRRSTEERTTLTAQLQHAVNSHRIVEQAKGVLAERHKVSPDAAFDSLRRHARSQNSKLNDIANAIISGDFNPG